jgi:type II secretory pathway component PulF
MTDIFTLDAELDEPGAVDEVPSILPTSDAPSTGWQPGQGGGFAALAAGLTAAPAEEPATRPKRSRKAKDPDAPLEAPVKMLPEPKPAKKLSRSQQAKADKAQRTKELNADAAAMRINGVDGDVEVPKKPWITVFSGKRARPDEVAETLTDLASMLENGQSEHKSVDALAVQYASYDIGQAYERVTMLLDRGVTLSAAMADQEDNFPPVVRELIGAAKMPKDMHRNLRQAAIIIVEADNIKSQIKSATFKPGLMFFFLIVFALAAVQWLLPMTTGMFTGIGAEVPPLTKTIMAVGEYLKWVLLGVLVLAMMWKLFWAVFGKTNERIATINDTLALKAPLVGDITRMAVAARFCDVLAACLAVGMSEIEALEILRELAETFHYKSQQRLNRFAERVGPITEGVVVVAVLVVVLLVISPILSFIPTMLETMKK